MRERFFFFLYSVFFSLFFLVNIPKYLWGCFFQRKYTFSTPYRLGLKFPSFSFLRNQVIWIHAVSVGEVKIALVLLKELKEEYPQIDFALSCVTETGYREAEKSLLETDTLFFLPLDFKWLMTLYVKRIKPQAVIFIESDLWPQLLSCLKQRGTQVFVMNGKLSDRSYRRYKKLDFYSHIIMSKIDHFILQNQTYLDRFYSLGVDLSKLSVGGNLKYSLPLKKSNEETKQAFKSKLLSGSDKTIITLASTHPKEEVLLLKELSTLIKDRKNLICIIAPRHPHRSQRVKKVCEKLKLSSCFYSEERKEESQVIIMDCIGLLHRCYEVSSVAVIGGSFVPVGGHNILEPLFFGVPTLFGPFMHQQFELAQDALKAGVAIQCNPDHLKAYVEDLLDDSLLRDALASKGSFFVDSRQEILQQNLNLFKKKLVVNKGL